MKQINNLRISHIRGGQPSYYHVRTLNGKTLEKEFGTFGDAVDFCEKTKDFLKTKFVCPVCNQSPCKGHVRFSSRFEHSNKFYETKGVKT